jgi:peptidylprolyl isomerase
MFKQFFGEAGMLKKGIVALASIILCLLALTTACSQSKQQAKNGDMVNVEYTGKLQNGTVFDSSRDSGQLEFTLGQGSVIPGFEQAVIGMEIGETKTITIPVDLAYGQRQDDMVQVVPREMLGDLEPEVGMQLGSTSIDGQTVIVTVTDVSEETITIDANPPLAGQDLNFEIKLVAIKASSGQTSGSASQPSAIYTKPLAQALASGRPTLAELGSSTCIPCKQMKPILEKLAVDNRDKLNVINIDVYDQPDLARQHKVISIPTQVVFDSSGKEVSRHIGVWPREQIDAELRKLGIN